jgi:hypothetical protein
MLPIQLGGERARIARVQPCGRSIRLVLWPADAPAAHSVARAVRRAFRERALERENQPVAERQWISGPRKLLTRKEDIMAKELYYRQCGLSRGTGRMVGYIEERGAIVGARVEVIADDKALWTVDSVADQKIPQSRLQFMQGANKHASISG